MPSTSIGTRGIKHLGYAGVCEFLSLFFTISAEWMDVFQWSW